MLANRVVAKSGTDCYEPDPAQLSVKYVCVWCNVKHLCGNIAVCIVPAHKGLGPAFVYNETSWIISTNHPRV